MDNKKNIIQYAIMGIFILFIVIAVLIFSGAIKIGSSTPKGVSGSVTMWGTISKSSISELLADFNEQNKDYTVNYIQVDPSNYESSLIDALASGAGPDIFMMPDDFIWKHFNKIYPIPYERITVRDYVDRYIDGVSIFRAPTAIFALPFTVDPLVMYYNRDLVSAAFYDKPPETWDGYYKFAFETTKRNEDQTIETSAIAFGAYDNILHAKDILSMLFLQTGNGITYFNGNTLDTDISVVPVGGNDPLTQSALVFYTDFANPATDFYSWNRSLNTDYDMFVSGKLAVYFGYASEVFGIRARNPNLNFDVAVVPQIKDSVSQVTYAKYTGLAVSKQSKNPATAILVAEQMAGRDFQEKLTEITRLPPVHKALLVADPVDPYDGIFKKSAFISKSWIDPNPASTSTAYETLIEDVLSGRMSVADAINDFVSTLESIIAK
ncbi:MAG: extracellular solute-binding protein [Candidatus Paceibacterota bacterium]